MKKLLMATTMLAALAVSAFAVAHPRTYVIEMADAGTTVDVAYNSYGPNYQATPDFTKFLKADKPQKGDTLEVHFKFKSNIDLPVLFAGAVDTSPQANYWTQLTGADYFLVGEDIKAGTIVDKVIKMPVEVGAKGKVTICLQYDNKDDTEHKKVNKAAKLTFTKTVKTTDTTKEVVKRTAPKTWSVNLSKYAAFLQIETNHPWVNGKQDMSVVANYQAVPDISKAFNNGKELPIKGDIINVTYRATSNIDIDEMRITVVENTEAVNWWADLAGGDEKFQVFAKDIKKGVPFDAKATFHLIQDAQEGISLQIFYEVGQGSGPAILKYAK